MLVEQKIWDVEQAADRLRLEFTDLIRFRDHWYCAFREADLHNSHPTARLRLMYSADAEHWQTVRLFDWADSDLRDPKLCLTAEGQLMLSSSLVFGTMQEPDPDDPRQRSSAFVPADVEDEQDDLLKIFVPHTYRKWSADPDEADGVMRQSVTWLSADGHAWSSAFCCPTGINTWRWDVTWHAGMGYSIGRQGLRGTEVTEDRGQLWRTRDGKSWRLLKEDLTPPGIRCNESSMAFAADGTAWCLTRSHPVFALLGRASGPYYQDWEWRQLNASTLRQPDVHPAQESLGVQMGSPQVMVLGDGRLVAIGRTDAGGLRGEVTERGDRGRISVFELDTEAALLTEWIEIDARSYAGIAEHDDRLWMSYGCCGSREIWVGSMPIPPLQS